MNQRQREAFGNYLKTLRNAQGLSQRAAAERAGLSCPYLSQIEKALRNPPSREILGRLAEVYNVAEEDLLRAAGYIPERDSQKLLGGIDLKRLDWAFTTVLRDPDFALGTRMSKGHITPEVKAWVVELYLKTTKRAILNEEEVNQLKEIIGNDDLSASFGSSTESRQ